MANAELAVGGRVAWQGTVARQRLTFGYSLLAPGVLFMAALVGAPFFFSLYLSISDASVGQPVARFVGLQNFGAVFQDSVFRLAPRNTVVFTVIAGIFKALLGTLLAFLLIQEVRGKKSLSMTSRSWRTRWPDAHPRGAPRSRPPGGPRGVRRKGEEPPPSYLRTIC